MSIRQIVGRLRQTNRRSPLQRHRPPLPIVERLEPRIAPATLIDAQNVTFLDADGDTVTVNLSAPLFVAATVNKVLKFDTGSVDGNNALPQQLRLVDLSKLASAGVDVTITGVGGDGSVKVGFINARLRDLGEVTIGGDLGRIVAGDANKATPGLQLLDVKSLGQFGTTTQRPGGTLKTQIDGSLGALMVQDDIVNASISVRGGAAAQLGMVEIGGSLRGGVKAQSGTILSTGGIGPVEIGGDLQGGVGRGSGVIATSGSLGAVILHGGLLGGEGIDSGVIRSVQNLASVTIDGDVRGGAGKFSGAIGATGSLGAVTVHGSLLGGVGRESGVIRSQLDMGALTIEVDVLGGGGATSGVVGTAGALASALVHGSVRGGAGGFSGAILSGGGTGPVQVDGDVEGGAGGASGVIGTAGALGAVNLGGKLAGGAGAGSGALLSGVNIGPLEIGCALAGGAIRSGGNIAGLAVGTSGTGGMENAVVNARQNIGPISAAGDIEDSVFIAGAQFGNTFTAAGAGETLAAIGFAPKKFTAGTAPANIVSVTLLPGAGDPFPEIVQSSFIAGITGAGADRTFGTLDDAGFAGSSIGAIVAPGGFTASLVVSGSLGSTQTINGQMAATAYLAGDSAGTGIGSLSIVYTIPAGADDARNDAVNGVTLTSAAAIGNFSATLNGVRTDAAVPQDTARGVTNSAIEATVLNAATSIGNLTGINTSTGPAGRAGDGLGKMTVRAGLRPEAAGGIGNIAGFVMAGDNEQSDAIEDSTFDAAAGPGSRGGILGITGITQAFGGGANGIDNSVFRANGNLGGIQGVANSGFGIIDSLFSAFGNIGTINVNGSVDRTRFLAGYDIGADLAFGVPGASDDRVSPAASSIAGIFLGSGGFFESDAITSANHGDGTYGNGDGENSAPGSSIGQILIAVPAGFGTNPFPDGPAIHAIQSAALGVIALGGGPPTFFGGSLPTVFGIRIDPDFPAGAPDGDEIRIRLI